MLMLWNIIEFQSTDQIQIIYSTIYRFYTFFKCNNVAQSLIFVNFLNFSAAAPIFSAIIYNYSF